MYELSRVRLFSVGPAGARYADVVLDFRDVGVPVRAPAQEALFATEAPGVPRRPSPASVLFLENGGGKSVLIKLIFSVMLPGRRQVVGTTNTRVLEKFVRATDVAQVVLEWQHTETGARVVTGKVSEWRGHVVSTDPAKLIDAWYSFRPTASFSLDSLPVTDNGRLVTLSGFRERFTEAHRLEPELQAVWTTGHADWIEHLTNLGLDPELFRYQRAMNAGEGEAAEAFTFKTDDAFVDFLLRAVVDEEDPRGLAEVVEGYADKLAQRGALGAERDFVAGALERLVPLADKENEAATARRLARDARSKAERFYQSVALRHAAEVERLSGGQLRLGELVDAEQKADAEVRRLGAVVLELRRLVAGLRLNAAEQEKSALEEELAEAKALATAWRETEKVLRALSSARTANDLRALVVEQEERARPALRARDETARALARALLDVAARAERDAKDADALVTSLRAKAGEFDKGHEEAVRAAERSRGEARGAEQKIAEVREAVASQVRAGLLREGADVAAEADLARARADAAEQALDEAVDRRERLGQAVRDADAALHAAQRTEDAAKVAEEKAAQAATRATGIAESLAGEERLAELLGAESVELDTDTPTLLDLIATAITTAEGDTTELRVRDDTDRRTLVALGEGGLLPAPEDVASTVDTLTAAGITAWPGWRYLATIAPEERAAVLERYPHLVDGVVLNDAGHLAHAETVLVNARLLPRSIVAVGTTEAINAGEGTPPAGIGFLVPPNPALYDEEKADAERIAIEARHRERQERIAELGRRISADRQLVHRLRQWRTDYPPGTLTRLLDEGMAAEVALRDAEAAVAARRGELDAAKSAEDEHLRVIPDLRRSVSDHAGRARVLADLAARVVHIGQWGAEAAAANEAARQAEDQAGEAKRQAATLRAQAEEKVRLADDHRRTAASCREELAGVHGGASVTEADPVAPEPLDTLRHAARAAAEAYAKVEVGSDLRVELEQAEVAESRARAEMEALAPEVRQRATELAATPDGAEAASRDTALLRAERAVSTVEERVRGAAQRVGELLAAYRQFVPQERSLEPYGKPESVPHGEDLVARASVDAEQARRRFDETRQARLRAVETVTRTKDTVDGLFGVLESLHGAQPDEPDPAAEPFEGDIPLARGRRDDIRTNLRDAESLLSAAEAEVREATDNLVQYATDDRFDPVVSPVRKQIIAVKRADLPGYAAEWERALRPRLRTLDDDLAQIDRHRSGIVTRLTGMVEAALRALRSAQRLSTLPDGLGDWSGQEFLRFRFADVDETTLAGRIGEVVDEAAGAGSSGKRDGMSLLLRGVHAVVPRGFRVEMLKPDAVLRTERLRVSEIRDVFSGGQQLTAAIILYCTLAALRANDRGRARHRHSGVLFLDNPIGRASAGYLLELQLAVAQALGVQLVYTTGLFDAGALSVFPLIIRLRNDADLRAGLKYLSVDATVRQSLASLAEPDGTGRVDVTRVFHRPPEQAPAS